MLGTPLGIRAHRRCPQPVLTRRALLRVGLAAGASGLLASCLPGPNAAPGAKTGAPAVVPSELDASPGPLKTPEPARPTQAAGPPRRGGVLRLAVPSLVQRLDPAVHAGSDDSIIGGAIFSSLVRVDPKLQPRAELASGWRVSDDGLVWTFTLRRGVRFHHGRELDSRDVEFTYRRVLDPATGSSGRSLLELVQGLERPDPHTIRLSLAAPYADLPLLLGSAYLRILPFDAADDLARTPVGTGPFKLKELLPGERAVLARNAHYWDKDSGGNLLPFLDEVRLAPMPDAGSQAAALEAEAIDLLWEAPLQGLASLRLLPHLTVLEMPSPAYPALTIKVGKPPFDSPKVRLALKYTVERDTLLKRVLGGPGTPSNDNPVSPASPFWLDTGMRKRDLDKARGLLAEAGFRDGLDLELVVSPERSGLVELAAVLKEMAAPAGFRLAIKEVPWDVFAAEYARKHPLTLQSWNGRPSIDETLFPYFHSKGSSIDLYDYSNKEVDQLLERGRAERDPARRKEFYARVQKILVEDGPCLIPYHRPHVTAHHKRVNGSEIHPLRWCDLRGVWLA